MRINIFIVVTLILLVAYVAIKQYYKNNVSGAPPYGESEEDVPDTDPFGLKNWVRPDGPPKVGLQVGHWMSQDVPEELARIRSNTGSSGAGKWEWEVNLAIAQVLKKRLEENGILVDLLPATIPPSYWADVFIAIHADGSTDKTKSGFKIASSWRDYTRKADRLISLLEESYSKSVDIPKDGVITRNMRGYYAFSWWRYEHAVHPMTTSAIVETGFLTNSKDQKILINTPDIPAKALSDGVIKFLKTEALLK